MIETAPKTRNLLTAALIVVIHWVFMAKNEYEIGREMQFLEISEYGDYATNAPPESLMIQNLRILWPGNTTKAKTARYLDQKKSKVDIFK